MASSADSASERPVLGYVEPSLNQVTPATTLTGVMALVALACVAGGLVLIAVETIGAYRAARWNQQPSLDRALVILARPRTFQRPEFAGRWWLTFSLTACAAWVAVVGWTAVAAQRVLRSGRYALASLRLRGWGLAGVAAVGMVILLRYGAHIRRVFQDWDLLGDFLYRSTGLLTVATFAAGMVSVLLAVWIEHRYRRLRGEMPHLRP